MSVFSILVCYVTLSAVHVVLRFLRMLQCTLRTHARGLSGLIKTLAGARGHFKSPVSELLLHSRSSYFGSSCYSMSATPQQLLTFIDSTPTPFHLVTEAQVASPPAPTFNALLLLLVIL